MTPYNEEQALVNHTEAWRIISRLREKVVRLNKRIKDLSGMVSWL